MQNNYEIPSDQLLADAKVSQPFDTQQSLDNLSTTARGPAGLGVITEASPGTQIVRDGARLPVEGKQALVPGDRVVVPKDGFANVVLPGRQPGETPLAGTFTGGTEAVVGLKPGAAGVADQLQVELVSGDLIVNGAEEAAKATTLAVKKPGSAGEGAGAGWLLPLALGGLIGALAARGNDDDNTNQSPTTPTNPTTPTDPTTPTTPPNPTTPPVTTVQGLLDPANTLVNNLTNAVGTPAAAAPGVGGVLAVVDTAVGTVTNAGNGALAPLLGDQFNPNTPNALDPVDTAVAQLTAPLTNVLGGVLDPSLGAGTVASLINPLNAQVDFLTDGVATLLGGGTGGSLLGITSTDATPNGNGLLDPASALVDKLTDGLDSGLLAGAGLGGVLEPVDSLVGTVTNLGNNLTTPLLGQTFSPATPNSLDPADALVGQVTDGLSDPLATLLDPLLGQGTVSSVLNTLDTQVDFATDGVANLLGDNTTGSNLRDLLGLGSTDTTTAGDGLLDPASKLVDQLTDGLDGGLLESLQLSGILEPVDSTVNTVTDLGNELLSPLLGEPFAASNTNALDPVDSLVVQVTDGLGDPLATLLEPLLGDGTTGAILGSLNTQVDYATDGVATLLGGLTGGDLPLGDLASALSSPTSLLPVSGSALPDTSALGPIGGLLGGRLF